MLERQQFLPPSVEQRSACLSIEPITIRTSLPHFALLRQFPDQMNDNQTLKKLRFFKPMECAFLDSTRRTR